MKYVNPFDYYRGMFAFQPIHIIHAMHLVLIHVRMSLVAKVSDRSNNFLYYLFELSSVHCR